MRVVALVSGGKDSCFNMMQCIAAGHDIVALANLYPVGKDELDSFMFQTVGYKGVEYISEAIGLPIYREPTFGRSKMQEKYYYPTENDEVEDLFRLLSKVKEKENIEAVSSGSILSDYQRIRVENVCSRLGLISLSYLWRREQDELLKEMIGSSVNAVIIKVAALGLEPRHLGKSLFEMQSHLAKIVSQFNPPSPMEILYEEEDYPDVPVVNRNQTGWFWFGGIAGKHPDAKSAMREALEKLSSLVKKENLQISDIVAVTLYIKDMSNYISINEVYISCFNKTNPPVRVCVECPLNIHVVLDAIAYKEIQDCGDKKVHKRHTMHVQSISHWAPANIGPYSQAVRVGDIISVAGQIPLVPGSMTILDLNIKRQCRLTLRHIDRIVKAMDSNTQLRDIVQGICFLTHTSYIPDARKEWEKRTNNAIVDYIVVPNLPRGAQVEWCVWAHRDNNRFEYEETGKCVSNFKVAIRRRWNYENNVSAIVCYMSTGSSNSTGNLAMETSLSSTELTVDELTEAFEYVLCKLTKGSQTLNPTCNLRIFYKVGSSPGPNFVQDVLSKFSTRNLVTTIIPATHLHNFSTFLSICGIRHE
ncbi:ATP-binding domain-containing protein 4 [Eufriesea mexicana]|nr:ATP-binding domain-containing protein 4 [Eufriesea mexicana]